jgi:hypothetical protein
MILNIILICSLSLSSVNGSTLDVAKVVNTEDGNSKKLQDCVDEAKLWLSQYTGSKPSCRKKRMLLTK